MGELFHRGGQSAGSTSGHPDRGEQGGGDQREEKGPCDSGPFPDRRYGGGGSDRAGDVFGSGERDSDHQEATLLGVSDGPGEGMSDDRIGTGRAVAGAKVAVGVVEAELAARFGLGQLDRVAGHGCGVHQNRCP